MPRLNASNSPWVRVPLNQLAANTKFALNGPASSGRWQEMRLSWLWRPFAATIVGLCCFHTPLHHPWPPVSSQITPGGTQKSEMHPRRQQRADKSLGGIKTGKRFEAVLEQLRIAA